MYTMKKRIITNLALLFMVFYTIGIVSAGTCNLEISLLNQDPYPAIPGDYVKVVFEIDGLQNPDCGIVTFGIKEDYPIYLDPNVVNPIKINSGTYQKNYGSFYLAPYNLRVDANVLDGENPIEVYYSNSIGSTTTIIKEFNLTVEDTRADFEITIKDYDSTSKILTLEILNTGKADIEALTIEIPDQDNIKVEGSYRNIVGDLDSNDYTTADFKATPKDGEITLSVIYTDSINVRRNLQKTVTFESKYFKSNGNGGSSYGIYIIVLLIIVGIGYWIYRRRQKKKAAKHHLHNKH